MFGVDPTHANNGSWERISEFLGEDLEERRYEPQSSGISAFQQMNTLLLMIVPIATTFIAQTALSLLITA